MVTEAQERNRIEVNEMATGEEEMDVTKPNEKESSEAIEMETSSQCSNPTVVRTSNLTVQFTSHRVVETNETIAHNPGFVLVIDNINMNVRQSEQRVDHTTCSYHYLLC